VEPLRCHPVCEQRWPVVPRVIEWRQAGKELFYITTLKRKLVAVEVNRLGSSINYGSPIELFDVGAVAATGHSGGPFHLYAVSPDGERFLVPHPVSPRDATASPPITVIQSWAKSIGR
jgi:hypothetical protein